MSELKTNSIDSLNGTDEVSIPTLDQRFAKAWVNFNGTGTISIRDDYNVSSLVDNGVGDYTINYEVAISANNCVNASSASSGVTSVVSASSGSSRIVITTDPSLVCLSAFSN